MATTSAMSTCLVITPSSCEVAKVPESSTLCEDNCSMGWNHNTVINMKLTYLNFSNLKYLTTMTPCSRDGDTCTREDVGDWIAMSIVTGSSWPTWPYPIIHDKQNKTIQWSIQKQWYLKIISHI